MADQPTVESGADTLPAATAAPSEPARVDTAPAASLDEASFAGRYQSRAVLGTGGMGEVHLVRDGRIGRDVALKVARPSAGSSGSGGGARFVREARLQGQLEHPAVVPVYDLGRRPDGAAYFTMKRVRGLSLEEILAGLRAGDEALAARFSRRKLLAAFSQVCLAVHFAHTRGVVHRDLKPANVMLGDFGEVYVLDWGVAKVLDAAEEGPLEATADDAPVPVTLGGAVLGTPGYMAPEQARGDALDARADVYSLGAVLFEILTHERLFPSRSVAELLAATLEGADARCSSRAPAAEAPPELEAICVRATAYDRAERQASARELSDEVERYLDGDRDLERRRELADGFARAAGEAAARAVDEGDEADRREALAQAGRALALDPTHAGAMRSMLRVLLEPPRRLPDEVLAEAERSREHALKLSAVTATIIYFGWLAVLPMFMWIGVRDFRPVALMLGLMVGAGLVALSTAKRTRVDWRRQTLACLLSCAGLAVLARFMGPFLVVPGAVALNIVGFMLHTPPGWRRALNLMIGVVAVVLPALLEWTGVLSTTTFIVDGSISVGSPVLWLAATPVKVVLLLSSVVISLIPAWFVAGVRDNLAASEERSFLQSWHLRQLIPEEARGALDVPRPARPLFDCQR